MTIEKRSQLKRFHWIPFVIFLMVFCGHAFYLRYQAAVPADGWADVGVGYGEMWGFKSYITEQDFYLGFSYALGAAFTAWAVEQFIRTRQAAMATGAVGSVTFVGVLMAAGCFLIGCCGSPMMGVYLGLFGAKALGIGKPLMAVVTIISVGWGYWYLSRPATKGLCTGDECNCSK